MYSDSTVCTKLGTFLAKYCHSHSSSLKIFNGDCSFLKLFHRDKSIFSIIMHFGEVLTVGSLSKLCKCKKITDFAIDSYSKGHESLEPPT